MEVLRRLIYYGCCFMAIIGVFYTDLSPVVIIDIFEPDKDSRGKARKYAESLLSEEEQKAIAQKRQLEIVSNTLTVKESKWLEIYEQLKALKERKTLADNYKQRLPSDQYPMSLFFFRINEQPIGEIAGHLNRDTQQLYLRIVRDKEQTNPLATYDIDGIRILRLDYRIYSGDDFHLGTGLSRYPRPPTWMLYPYRHISLYIFLFGLACYILLPVRKISQNAIRYPRWRVILGDMVATILTFTFFSMPFLIIGSAQQTVYPWFIFSMVFWLISLLGIYSIIIAIWYASYQIDLRDDGITIASYKGIRHFQFDDIEYYQPLIFKPPKWLIFLTWLAALSGRGGAGRAILLSSSETGAIALRLRDGKEFYITVTDQMGTTALKGFEKVLETLEKNKVKFKEEVKEIRSMGMEIMR